MNAPPPPPPRPSASASASAPPPPPSKNGPIPPFGPGPRGPPPIQSLTRGRSPSQPKRNGLKPYHWQKFSAVMQGTLWDDAQKCGDADKAPDIDMSELEDLFAAPPVSTRKRVKGGAKIERVRLIETKRAMACEILLARMKLPLPDLMNAMLELDDSVLHFEQLEGLIRYCPKEEEIKLLKGYIGDVKNLGDCEQFFLEMMKLPRVELKLCAFIFKMQFNYKIIDMKNKLDILNSACKEVRSSEKFRKIMQTILQLGNAINHGTVRGSAVGFRLDGLSRLTEIKAKNNKTTLMHYLCKVVAEKQPEIVDFSKDLQNLESASKLQLKDMVEEMQTITKELEKVFEELISSQSDGPMSENFCKKLKQFISFAEGEMKSLVSLYSDVGRNADILVKYFGENRVNYPFEQVIMTLRNFVKMFVKLHGENCKQLELKMKRIQREIERDNYIMKK